MARIETTVDLEKDLTMYVVNGHLSSDEIIEKVIVYYTEHNQASPVDNGGCIHLWNFNRRN